jgi:opacity protein-like surface antigen
MRVLVAALLLLLTTSAAHAQRVEITPFAGYRVGGSFSVLDDGETELGRDLEVADEPAWGVHLGYEVSDDGEIELLYSRQETRVQTDDLFTGQPVLDLALETWQFGGNYLWGEDQQRVRPYIGVGLGITRLLPEPAGLQDETRFSLSAAAGVKVWLTRNLGLRFEARGFFTVLESDREYFCTLPGTCLVAGDTADLSQAEARGGIVLRF